MNKADRNRPAGRDNPIRMPEHEYAEYSQDDTGICIDCLSTRDNCEPDARRYSCPACGMSSVYGAEELLIMGAIEFTGKADPDGDL